MNHTDDRRGGAYAWYVVAVLILAYTFSYVDRTILTLMVDPIRRSLGISDIQVSLLHGIAFAVFYTALGLPIGRLVDRRSRIGIITAGVATWSIMTALCGLARGFGGMFLARVGVGAGEATLSPAAYSILGDYFPPHRLARALSVFTAAMYVGSGLAMIAGGAMIAIVPTATLPLLGELEPWRLVFLIVGLPGLLVAGLVATLREPKRHGAKIAPGTQPSIGEVVRHLGRHRGAYGNVILGLSLSSLVWNGASAWIPTFFIRNHGWSSGQIGTVYGLIVLVAGTAGIIGGSLIADAMRARGHRDAAVRVAIGSSIVMAPAALGIALAGSAALAAAFAALFVFVAALPYGNGAAAVQEITPNQMRGQIAALYIFGINFAGIGLGPMVVAAIARMLGGDLMLGNALAATALVAGPLSAIVLLSAGRPYIRALDAEERGYAV